MMQEIIYYQDLLKNNQASEYDLDRYNEETNNLNNLINEEKSLERKLV